MTACSERSRRRESYILANDSSCATAANAQHDPQPPWLVTGVVPLRARQSKEAGSAALPAGVPVMESLGDRPGGACDGSRPRRSFFSCAEREPGHVIPAVQVPPLSVISRFSRATRSSCVSSADEGAGRTRIDTSNTTERRRADRTRQLYLI